MRKPMKPWLLSVGLVVCPVLAICQQAIPVTLSLADAIALARQHNPAYRQTIHDRSPAAWGVRNAWSSLWIPNVTASAGVIDAGPGEQNFLTSSFSQSVSTWSSNYNFLLDWTLNGQTLSQPGLKQAQLNAAQADVVGAETNLATAVTQQYLTVLQARDNAEVARQQLDHDEQFLRLAQARYEVGRASLIDVRQAQVARGAAEVSLLRARTAVQVEKLRLFQQIGVSAPVDLGTVQLTDTFSVQTPTWRLGDLLGMAEQQNPSLKALLELGSIGGAVGRLVRLHTETLRRQSDARGDPTERANGFPGVCVRERGVVEHGTDSPQLRRAHEHGRPGAGAARPEQPLSVPLHA